MYRVDFLLVLFGGKEGVTRFKVLPVVHPAASAATDGEPGGSRLTVDWSEIIARSALILPSFFPFCSALFLSLESPYCSSTWGRSSYRIKSIICIDRVVDRVREIDRLGEGEMMHSPLSLSNISTDEMSSQLLRFPLLWAMQPFSSILFFPLFTPFYSCVCV